MTPDDFQLNVKDPLHKWVPDVLAGDARKTEEFVRAFAPAVLRVIRQILGVHHPDVPDVAQETTFAVIDALPRFRGESTVLHFICRVAALTAMNARRRWKVRARYAEDTPDIDQFESEAESPFGLAVAAKRRDAFRQLLDELPALQAEALILHGVLGWTVEEAAAAANVPPNTLRGRLITARNALRKRIAGDPELSELLQGVS